MSACAHPRPPGNSQIVYKASTAADMADDLDELLDEIESKFCRNVPVTSEICHRGDKSRPPAHAGSKTEDAKGKQSCRKDASTSHDDEDIDDLIEDIFNDDFEPPKFCEDKHKAAKDDTRSSSFLTSRKCCPVFLGSSAVPLGVGTTTSQRACGLLRCTSCDFRVLTFDDHEWDPSCDYLFFRNNMPDCHRLKAKLVTAPGVRAHACQCSWRSVRSLTNLRREPQLRWVCGKHHA
ncbi:cilia- and flagella-associated protein 418 [Lepisosteus oculatus]|uniref:cilia- and flagella-associated protein 418 n=1 Tax=Lepisosteus oculatus TaxID=7918 RepID=UPI0035F52F0C